MKHKEHCEESIRLFGKPFAEVHSWLDEFSHLPDGIGGIRFNAYHRRHRHHLAGAEQIKEMFGQEAYAVAIRHIISDFVSGEGFKEGRDTIPKDEKDYIRMGFF